MQRAVAAVALAAAILALAAGPAPAANPHTTTTTTPVATAPTGPLVLYDTSGPYGWLGELYATEVTNLAGHFGSPVAHAVSGYKAGELRQYPAVVYIGSTYDEPLPAAFLTFHRVTTPIPIQTTFSAVEGMASCHQPLITKPAAPTMFIAW